MTEELRQALEQMLNDLEAHKLEVQLAPLNPRMRGWSESGMKRVVVDAPPKFYRALCAKHISQRVTRKGKPDTAIRRANILSALNRMLSGKSGGVYEADLLAHAKRLAATLAQNPF